MARRASTIRLMFLHYPVDTENDSQGGNIRLFLAETLVDGWELGARKVRLCPQKSARGSLSHHKSSHVGSRPTVSFP